MRSVEFHYLGFVRDLHAVRHAPSEGLEAIATTISIPEKLVKRCRIAKNGSMKLRQSQKTWISKHSCIQLPKCSTRKPRIAGT
jgi:hypothetical protein